MEAELRSWIERETGGKVTRFDRTPTGASRGTWLVDVERAAGEDLELVLRRDTGDGPLSGTELSLAREAVVYRALRDLPVRIPRLVTSTPDGTALLIERARGSEAFATIAEAERKDAVARDYLSALAELHSVDVEALDLTGFDRPRDAAGHARCDLALWRRIFDRHVKEPDPLIALAFAALEERAPRTVERTALCHGDAGPGNFLFEEDRVTALLDWEFAHPGDALDDLAWVSVRAHLLGGFGDLTALYRHWSEQSGLPVNLERIDYYRALVLVRMATSCLVALGHAGEREMNTTVYEMLLPYLRFMLPDVLVRLGADSPLLREHAKHAHEAIAESPVLNGIAKPLPLLESV